MIFPYRSAPRIQILVVGFNRSLSRCLASIQKNVIETARDTSPNVDTRFILSRTRSAISNDWSKEIGTAEYEIPSSIPRTQLTVFEQTQVDWETSELVEATLGSRTSLTTQDRHITINLIRYLWLLKEASRLVNPDVDYVIHVRPDLQFVDPMDLRLVTKTKWGRRFRGIATANWGWQPNDRFALMSLDAAHVYFSRLEMLSAFVDTGIEFSGESLLSFAMRRTRHSASLNVRAARVRIDGSVKDEPFHKAKFHPTRRRGGVAGQIKRAFGSNKK